MQAKLEPVLIEILATNAVTHLKDSALVVDAFDNREARSAVSEAVSTLKIPCLHIGFSADGLYGNGLWEPGYQVPREVPAIIP